MIRRAVLAAAILVLAAVLGLPPVFGTRARAMIEPQLAGLGEPLAPDVALSVTVDQWNAGWFSSTAMVTVALDARTWRDTVTLHHGPVIVGGLSGLGWGSVALAIDSHAVPELAAFEARSDVQEVARVASLVGFFGATTVAVEVSPFQTAGDASGPGVVRFLGLGARLTVNRAGNRVHVEGALHGASVTAPDMPITEIGTLEAELHLARSPTQADLWLGDGTLDLARLAMRDREAGSTLEVDTAHLEAEAAIRGADLVWTGLQTARALRVAAIELHDVELGTTLTYPVAAQRRVANGDTQHLESRDFAREHMTLRVDPLRFNHLDMPLEATLAVDYRGDLLADGATLDFADVAGVVEADLELSIHKGLPAALGLDIGDRLMQAMVDQGLAVASGDAYRSQASFRDGRLASNGQPIELALLLALLAAA